MDEDKKFPGITAGGAAVMLGFLVTTVNLIVFAGSPAWLGSAALNFVERFQTIIVGLLAFVGILAGFVSTRRRDKRLRDKEARAFALALYGELTAAFITCSAFLNQIRANLAEDRDDNWLNQEILATNFGPHVRTKVFDANASKLGLLGESLVGSADPKEQLVVEVVTIFDMLSDYARIAQKQQVMPRRELLESWRQLVPNLEDTTAWIEETMAILRAYIAGGLPAATATAKAIMPARDVRREKMRRELNINPAPEDDTA